MSNYRKLSSLQFETIFAQMSYYLNSRPLLSSGEVQLCVNDLVQGGTLTQTSQFPESRLTKRFSDKQKLMLRWRETYWRYWEEDCLRLHKWYITATRQVSKGDIVFIRDRPRLSLHAFEVCEVIWVKTNSIDGQVREVKIKLGSSDGTKHTVLNRDVRNVCVILKNEDRNRVHELDEVWHQGEQDPEGQDEPIGATDQADDLVQSQPVPDQSAQHVLDDLADQADLAVQPQGDPSAHDVNSELDEEAQPSFPAAAPSVHIDKPGINVTPPITPAPVTTPILRGPDQNGDSEQHTKIVRSPPVSLQQSSHMGAQIIDSGDISHGCRRLRHRR